MTIVKLNNVKKYFPIQRGYLKETIGMVNAVDGVSFEIQKGEAFGLVGESGCGKTTLGRMILGIIEPDSGEVKVEVKRMQAIFQDPHSSLDPKMNVFDILSEGLVLAKERPAYGAIRDKIEKTLDLVNLPKEALKKYPHQFSGGERQRIAIGRAVITDPDFIVCDEPVSSLDVTIQLQILRLLKDIQRRMDITYLFISHDLRVVRFMCDRVAVMKEGKIVEEGQSRAIYSNPSAPYTKLLLSSVLDIGV